MATVLFFTVLAFVLFFHQSFRNLVRDELFPEEMAEFQKDNRNFWTVCALLALGGTVNARNSSGWTEWAISIALVLLVLLCSGFRFYNGFQILKRAYSR